MRYAWIFARYGGALRDQEGSVVGYDDAVLGYDDTIERHDDRVARSGRSLEGYEGSFGRHVGRVGALGREFVSDGRCAVADDGSPGRFLGHPVRYA